MQKQMPGYLIPINGWAAAIIIACCACWGVNQVAIKVANAGIPPMLQAGLRSLCSGLLLMIWAWARGIPLFNRDGTLAAGIAIGVVFGVEFVLLYQGLAWTTASRGVLFLYSMPFFVAVGAHLLIPGDRLTRPKVIGLLAAFCGLAVALGDGLLTSGGSLSFLGDVMCLLAGAGWGATTLMIRTTAIRFASAEKALFYQLAVSAPLLIAASFIAGEGTPSFSDPIPLLAFAYTAILVAFISYVTWLWLLTRHSPSAMSTFTFLTPIFGALAGHLILNEPLTFRLAIALALVAFGIYLVNRPASARA